MIRVAPRLKAAFIHLMLSGVIGALTAAVVFGLWFPWPYRVMAGGQALFILIVSVDLVMGPALTLVVFNASKARPVLARDLAVIGLLQLAALAYGIHTMYIARPVAIVFEEQRFRVLSEADVYLPELTKAPPGLRRLSLSGPQLLGTRKPASGAEKLNSIEMALQGFDVGSRPVFWQAYAASVPQVLSGTRPVSLLYQRYPASRAQVEQQVKQGAPSTAQASAELRFAPVISKLGDWCILIDGSTGMPAGFVEYNGFF
jgi:hypothetical protein